MHLSFYTCSCAQSHTLKGGREQEKSFTFSGSIQQKNGVAGIEPSSEGILVTETFPGNIDWR